MGKPLASPQSPQCCHFQLHLRQSCHLLHRQERHFQMMRIQNLTPGLRLVPGLGWRILDWVGSLQIWNKRAGRLKKRSSFLDSHMWSQWLRQSQIYQNGSTCSSYVVRLRLEQEYHHQDEVAGQPQLGYFSNCYTFNFRYGRHTYRSNQSTQQNGAGT